MKSSKSYISTPGNTNTGVEKKKQPKSRHFQLTMNCELIGDNSKQDIENSRIELLKNYDNVQKYLLGLKYIYYVSCMEIHTENDYWHIHIYIQFENPHTLNILKCMGAHIECCRGSSKECIDYIKKLEKPGEYIIEEHGTPKIYIGGSATIKQILDAKPDELKQMDYKYFNVINNIKMKPINWNRQALNTKKDLKIYDSLDKVPEKDLENYTIINIIKSCVYNISENIIILKNNFSMPLLNKLLNKFNIPIHSEYGQFYPANINKIIVINGDLDEFEVYKAYKSMIN